MRALHYNKRKHATEFPAAYVFIGNIGSVVHHVRDVQGADGLAFLRIE